MVHSSGSRWIGAQGPRALALVLLLAVVSALVGGCGGGGGGTAAPVLNYATVWGDLAQPVRSQTLTVTTLAGDPLATRVLNPADGDGLSLTDLPAGPIRLRITAHPLADGAGTALGQVDARLELRGPTWFRTRVGATPARLIVAPDPVTVIQDRTLAFTATAVASDGIAVFAPAGAFSWRVLGGVGTVDSNGRFTAETAGAGGIEASWAGSGAAAGAAAVTVTPQTVTRSAWTVLVYLNAANDLYRYSDPNVDQMERVADNPEVRFVVQWKQARSQFPSSSFNGTRRYRVTPNTTEGVQSELLQDLGDVDMGDPATLREFIAWGQRNYPADRTVVVVWNHGSGWASRGVEATRAVSFDDETGNAIQTWELGAALQGFPIEVLAFDASLMQMLEVAYELRGLAAYVAGSEESPPGEGYPYDQVFAGFRDRPTASTESLTKGFVDGMLNDPRYASRKITQSVINTDRLGLVGERLDVLAQSLIDHRAQIGTAVTVARATSQSFSPSTQRYYRDLRHLGSVLRVQADVPAPVIAAIANLDAAVAAATVWEGHNSNSPNATGLAIDFSPGSRFTAIASEYGRLRLAQDTRWDEWLRVAP